MPIQHHPMRKKPWTVTWINPWTGSKRSKSFDNHDLAIAFEQAQTELAEKEKAILRKQKKEKNNTSKITVLELVNTFFKMNYKNPITIRENKYHAVHLTKVFGGRQAMLLTRQDIFNFIEAQSIRGLSPTTINRRIGVLKASLNWAAIYGLIPQNPLADLRLPKAKTRRISPPSPLEAKAILKVAAPHVQRVIILGLSAGPRIGPSELFRLQWRDIDFELGMMRMPSAQKNWHQDSRDIPIRSTLLPLLKKWYAHDNQKNISHVISWNGRPIKHINGAWKAALKKAGIERRIRPYDLRHAFATYAPAGAADIGSVATLMGHVDASMILKTYQHVQDTQKRAAVEAAPDILGLKKIKKHDEDSLPGI